MKSKILITSFRTWLPHHKSNSSDDLLEIFQQQQYNLFSLDFIRNLPVDTELASQRVIKIIENIKPDAVICCGMAESRNRLTIESSAVCQRKCLKTDVNLEVLKSLLASTDISHDAGKFVCEGLYFQVLQHITKSNTNYIPCLFVHVPLLTNSNLESIKKDFLLILEFIVKSR